MEPSWTPVQSDGGAAYRTVNPESRRYFVDGRNFAGEDWFAEISDLFAGSFSYGDYAASIDEGRSDGRGWHLSHSRFSGADRARSGYDRAGAGEEAGRHLPARGGGRL